ncbi:hypothetical protein JDV02_004356 [Purpureocillium takamizusanense]|uniref:Extracellular membrane protein CFEM domain-containing protein n=1 Tax=Purpureocillium takamizusanense TaxID=2060973 RepID=A0A9Q8QED0_9HYPO|nr:uncharacterized protein JDV02_004356 [Purpureocillium takamizusanense]UNI18060.1 hypothetical protein JDV02_004356 [Purpureocillium takamizusanense]
MVRIRWRDTLPLLAASSAVALDSDFSFYPKNAQPCLNSAASKSKCSGSDAVELNTCFCGNEGDFIINTARCLGKDDKDDVQSVYKIMLQACTDSHTPMSVSQSDFIQAANGQDSITTTITTMPTYTPTDGSQTVTVTPTATGTDGSNGSGNSGGGDRLSSGATIGIAVGASLAGMAALGGFGYLFLRRRRRGNVEESRPMLVPPEYYHHMTGTATTTTYPPTDPSIDFGRLSAITESKSAAWPPSPGSASHPSPGTYPSPFTPSPPPPLPPPPPDGIASQEPSPAGLEIFEMDATSVPKTSGSPGKPDTQSGI